MYVGFHIAECATCNREQSFLGDEQMESIGWRKINGKWECPFCTGNERLLNKIWDEKETE